MIGFFSNNLRSDSGKENYAIKELEQQEYGKKIPAKSFVPLDSARVGGHTSLVKPVNRLGRILPQHKLVIARNLRGSSKKEQFVRAIYKAGTGGYIIGSNIKGENLLWRVDSLNLEAEGKKFRITPLYSYKKGRQIKVKETPFMRTASNQSAEKLDDFFIKQAEFWISRYMK